MMRIRSSSEILEQIRAERVRELAMTPPTPFRRENSRPASRIAGAVAFVGGLALFAISRCAEWGKAGMVFSEFYEYTP